MSDVNGRMDMRIGHDGITFTARWGVCVATAPHGHEPASGMAVAFGTAAVTVATMAGTVVVPPGDRVVVLTDAETCPPGVAWLSTDDRPRDPLKVVWLFWNMPFAWVLGVWTITALVFIVLLALVMKIIAKPKRK
jgi:hypothetical protein